MALRQILFGCSVGSRQVSGAQVQPQGQKGVLRRYRAEPIPAGTVLPSPLEPNILNPSAYEIGCHRVMEGIPKGAVCSLSLPDSSVRLSILEFQHLPKARHDLEQLIRWQMEKVYLYPLKEARITYQPLGERDGKHRLLAMAMREEILNQYLRPLQSRGVEPRAVGIVSFHLFNFYLPHLLSASRPSQDFIFLSKVDVNFTILICRKGIIDFVRVKELPLPEQNEAPHSDGITLDRIASELSTSIAFYQDAGGTPDPGHLFIASDRPLSDMEEPLRDHLKLSITPLSPGGRLKHPDKEGTDEQASVAAAAVLGGLS